MFGNNPIMDMLLLQSMNKSSTGSITDPIDQVLKWAEDYKKKEKEKADKAKHSTPNKPIFSFRDVAFILLGLGPFGGLFFIQGLAYVWNMTSQAVHTMQ
jgi:hypothetical protein